MARSFFALLVVASYACGFADLLASADVRSPRALSAGGIRIAVPDGWHGKVFADAPPGSVLLQETNRPFVHGGVPKMQPRGQVVVTILASRASTTKNRWRALHLTVRRSDFLPARSPRVPSGHALALMHLRFGTRALDIDVDFASPVVTDASLRSVNRRVLSTVAIQPK